MPTSGTITSNEMWPLLKGLLEDVLNDIELSTFEDLYHRENLYAAWGTQMHECLYFPQPIEAEKLFSRSAKLMLLLFSPVVQKNDTIKFSPEEAGLLPIVTRVIVQEIVYRYWMFVGSIVNGIQGKLHRLIIARNPETWDEFQKVLAIQELVKHEESIRSAGISEVPILPSAPPDIANGAQNPDCRLTWSAEIQDHKWLSDHLASKNVKWIASSDDWYNLFHPEIHHVGQVVIMRKHQERVALLIQLLIAAEMLVVAEGGKEFWDYLDSKFRSDSEKPLRKGWSRQASKIRNNEGNFRKFLKLVTPILSRLKIENDEIKKFFGKMWETLGKDAGTMKEGKK